LDGDFIASCRVGNQHDYDIVEGAMADDVIWDWVSDFLEGTISRTAFWELVKFRHPTHQISFHTPRALQCLKYNDHEFVTGVDDSAIKLLNSYKNINIKLFQRREKFRR